MYHSNILLFFCYCFVQALKVAHAGISLSQAEASVASPFTSKVCFRIYHYHLIVRNIKSHEDRRTLGDMLPQHDAGTSSFVCAVWDTL